VKVKVVNGTHFKQEGKLSLSLTFFHFPKELYCGLDPDRGRLRAGGKMGGEERNGGFLKVIPTTLSSFLARIASADQSAVCTIHRHLPEGGDPPIGV
jgi:hypothetical protein